jgi:hypothetical protein
MLVFALLEGGFCPTQLSGVDQLLLTVKLLWDRPPSQVWAGAPGTRANTINGIASSVQRRMEGAPSGDRESRIAFPPARVALSDSGRAGPCFIPRSDPLKQSPKKISEGRQSSGLFQIKRPGADVPRLKR